MRRGFALLLCGAAFALCTSPVAAQYYYPPAPGYYGRPMPVQYSPYGQPMMPRPVYNYPPAQMMRPAPMPYAPAQYAPSYQPRVTTYGPLLEIADEPVTNPPVLPRPIATTTKQPPMLPASGGSKYFGPVSKAEIPEEAYGPACGDGCGPTCGPTGCEPFVRHNDPRPRGHFVGEVGVLFLAPFTPATTAFVSAPAGGTAANTEFPHQLAVGERLSLAYICHNGWGVRGNYMHIGADTTSSFTNADATTAVASPLGVLLSPTASLTAGGAVDALRASQVIDVHVADFEFVKEASCGRSALLFSFGPRYANFYQGYHADVTVVGTQAANGVAEVRSADSSTRFEGVGPTLSGEVVCPLTCWGLSAYANVRGSWLFGTGRINNGTTTQTVTAAGAGVNTTIGGTDTTTFDSRNVSVAEVEGGLQFGCRIGKCYYFSRAGAVYQRWWNVGSATSGSGDVTFVGGQLMLGITY